VDDYCLDADRIWASDGYGATIYQLSDEKHTDPKQPFGFVRDLTPKRVDLPEPWMWWH
jgi:hypothetical protein